MTELDDKLLKNQENSTGNGVCFVLQYTCKERPLGQKQTNPNPSGFTFPHEMSRKKRTSGRNKKSRTVRARSPSPSASEGDEQEQGYPSVPSGLVGSAMHFVASTPAIIRALGASLTPSSSSKTKRGSSQGESHDLPPDMQPAESSRGSRSSARNMRTSDVAHNMVESGRLDTALQSRDEEGEDTIEFQNTPSTRRSERQREESADTSVDYHTTPRRSSRLASLSPGSASEAPVSSSRRTRSVSRQRSVRRSIHDSEEREGARGEDETTESVSTRTTTNATQSTRSTRSKKPYAKPARRSERRARNVETDVAQAEDEVPEKAVPVRAQLAAETLAPVLEDAHEYDEEQAEALEETQLSRKSRRERKPRHSKRGKKSTPELELEPQEHPVEEEESPVSLAVAMSAFPTPEEEEDQEEVEISAEREESWMSSVEGSDEQESEGTREVDMYEMEMEVEEPPFQGDDYEETDGTPKEAMESFEVGDQESEETMSGEGGSEDTGSEYSGTQTVSVQTLTSSQHELANPRRGNFFSTLRGFFHNLIGPLDSPPSEPEAASFGKQSFSTSEEDMVLHGPDVEDEAAEVKGLVEGETEGGQESGEEEGIVEEEEEEYPIDEDVISEADIGVQMEPQTEFGEYPVEQKIEASEEESEATTSPLARAKEEVEAEEAESPVESLESSMAHNAPVEEESTPEPEAEVELEIHVTTTIRTEVEKQKDEEEAEQEEKTVEEQGEEEIRVSSSLPEADSFTQEFQSIVQEPLPDFPTIAAAPMNEDEETAGTADVIETAQDEETMGAAPDAVVTTPIIEEVTTQTASTTFVASIVEPQIEEPISPDLDEGESTQFTALSVTTETMLETVASLFPEDDSHLDVVVSESGIIETVISGSAEALLSESTSGETVQSIETAETMEEASLSESSSPLAATTIPGVGQEENELEEPKGLIGEAENVISPLSLQDVFVPEEVRSSEVILEAQEAARQIENLLSAVSSYIIPNVEEQPPTQLGANSITLDVKPNEEVTSEEQKDINIDAFTGVAEFAEEEDEESYESTFSQVNEDEEGEGDELGEQAVEEEEEEIAMAEDVSDTESLSTEETKLAPEKLESIAPESQREEEQQEEEAESTEGESEIPPEEEDVASQEATQGEVQAQAEPAPTSVTIISPLSHDEKAGEASDEEEEPPFLDESIIYTPLAQSPFQYAEIPYLEREGIQKPVIPETLPPSRLKSPEEVENPPFAAFPGSPHPPDDALFLSPGSLSNKSSPGTQSPASVTSPIANFVASLVSATTSPTSPVQSPVRSPVCPISYDASVVTNTSASDTAPSVLAPLAKLAAGVTAVLSTLGKRSLAATASVTEDVLSSILAVGAELAAPIVKRRRLTDTASRPATTAADATATATSTFPISSPQFQARTPPPTPAFGAEDAVGLWGLGHVDAVGTPSRSPLNSLASLANRMEGTHSQTATKAASSLSPRRAHYPPGSVTPYAVVLFLRTHGRYGKSVQDMWNYYQAHKSLPKPAQKPTLAARGDSVSSISAGSSVVATRRKRSGVFGLRPAGYKRSRDYDSTTTTPLAVPSASPLAVPGIPSWIPTPPHPNFETSVRQRLSGSAFSVLLEPEEPAAPRPQTPDTTALANTSIATVTSASVAKTGEQSTRDVSEDSQSDAVPEVYVPKKSLSLSPIFRASKLSSTTTTTTAATAIASSIATEKKEGTSVVGGKRMHHDSFATQDKEGLLDGSKVSSFHSSVTTHPTASGTAKRSVQSMISVFQNTETTSTSFGAAGSSTFSSVFGSFPPISQSSASEPKTTRIVNAPHMAARFEESASEESTAENDDAEEVVGVESENESEYSSAEEMEGSLGSEQEDEGGSEEEEEIGSVEEGFLEEDDEEIGSEDDEEGAEEVEGDSESGSESGSDDEKQELSPEEEKKALAFANAFKGGPVQTTFVFGQPSTSSPAFDFAPAPPIAASTAPSTTAPLAPILSFGNSGPISKNAPAVVNSLHSLATTTSDASNGSAFSAELPPMSLSLKQALNVHASSDFNSPIVDDILARAEKKSSEFAF